jgi:hypothetical protein
MSEIHKEAHTFCQPQKQQEEQKECVHAHSSERVGQKDKLADLA